MAEKVNIVLGGTSGLGQEITARLRHDGEQVWALGSSYDSEKHGDGLKVDLASEKNVDKAVEDLRSRLGEQTIRSLWWVSGYGFNGDFAEQEDPRRMAVVNFAGALPIAQFAWREMLKQDGNSNFNIVSSTTGQKPRKNEAVYAGTKFALVGFGRSLGLESERLDSPVRVALFMPGGMRTPFWDGAEPDAYDTYNDPKKVADVMVDTANEQTEYFAELTIDRGTQV
jgi:NAD(P)-dependent dehydrogenase (short-subunit alcohol dehydrogenase family)